MGREEAVLDFDCAKVIAQLSLFPRQQGHTAQAQPLSLQQSSTWLEALSEGTVRSGGKFEQHRHHASPWAAVNLARHSIYLLPRPIAVTTVSI